jgi:hypothetical protein
MARKITIAVIAAVLVGAIALFAAQQPQEKKSAEKPKQEAKAVGQPEHKEGLLDQLIAAYKANDKEKMGEIIKKMELRRDNLRKLAKLNKWHQWAHRRWAMAGPPRDWQAGPGGQGGWGNQMPWGGPACWRGLAEGRQQWGQRPFYRGWGRDGCGPRAWGYNRPMRGWDGWGMPGWQQRQMRGWDGFGPQWDRPQRPAERRGLAEGGPSWRNAEPQRWDAPIGDEPRTDVPPQDWGW